MSKQKHTPGPWTIDVWKYSTANPPYKQLVILSKKMRLASIDWDEGKDNPYTIKEKEARANAELICAAPDMATEIERLRKVNADLLEALISLRALLGIVSTMEQKENPMFKQIVKKNNIIIAKAEKGGIR